MRRSNGALIERHNLMEHSGFIWFIFQIITGEFVSLQTETGSDLFLTGCIVRIMNGIR